MAQYRFIRWRYFILPVREVYQCYTLAYRRTLHSLRQFETSLTHLNRLIRGRYFHHGIWKPLWWLYVSLLADVTFTMTVGNLSDGTACAYQKTVLSPRHLEACLMALYRLIRWRYFHQDSWKHVSWLCICLSQDYTFTKAVGNRSHGSIQAY